MHEKLEKVIASRNWDLVIHLLEGKRPLDEFERLQYNYARGCQAIDKEAWGQAYKFLKDIKIAYRDSIDLKKTAFEHAQQRLEILTNEINDLIDNNKWSQAHNKIGQVNELEIILEIKSSEKFPEEKIAKIQQNIDAEKLWKIIETYQRQEDLSRAKRACNKFLKLYPDYYDIDRIKKLCEDLKKQQPSLLEKYYTALNALAVWRFFQRETDPNKLTGQEWFNDVKENLKETGNLIAFLTLIVTIFTLIVGICFGLIQSVPVVIAGINYISNTPSTPTDVPTKTSTPPTELPTSTNTSTSTNTPSPIVTTPAPTTPLPTSTPSPTNTPITPSPTGTTPPPVTATLTITPTPSHPPTPSPSATTTPTTPPLSTRTPTPRSTPVIQAINLTNNLEGQRLYGEVVSVIDGQTYVVRRNPPVEEGAIEQLPVGYEYQIDFPDKLIEAVDVRQSVGGTPFDYNPKVGDFWLVGENNFMRCTAADMNPYTITISLLRNGNVVAQTVGEFNVIDDPGCGTGGGSGSDIYSPSPGNTPPP